MLLVAMARSSFEDGAIRYVFLILWMTSCFTKANMPKNMPKMLQQNVADVVPLGRETSAFSGEKSSNRYIGRRNERSM